MDNQVLEVIKKRSSARAYSDEEVTKEQLEKVIEAGLQGPTGMNKKEIHFTVVRVMLQFWKSLMQRSVHFADRISSLTISIMRLRCSYS